MLSVLKPALLALRTHQWLKNLLVFVPVVLAHQYRDATALMALLRAFAAFCCASSCGYVLNDILDIEADKAHPGKRLRPFASGRLTRGFGLGLAAALFAVGMVLAASVSWEFLAVVASYLAASLTYSKFMKPLPLVDAFCLAAFYASRLFAGGLAADVPISPWLTAFAVFFFLNLAFLKRYTELGLHRDGGAAKKIRGYLTGDGALVLSFGTACGIVSALVLALYMNSESAFALYRHPQFLWAICFFLLYWVARTWLVAHRGEMHDDPVVFVIHDRASYVVVLLCVIVLAFAI